MISADRIQPTNPHGLAYWQHVVPVKSLARFAGESARVHVFDKARQTARYAKPTDRIFTVQRRWDQRAEVGFMKTIEDRFQNVAQNGMLRNGLLSLEDSEKVSRYFALLLARNEFTHEGSVVKSAAILPRDDTCILSKDQEEILEARYTSFFRSDGTMPARFVRSMEAQMRINKYMRNQMKGWRWGFCYSVGVDFVLPDYTSDAVIPVRPNICLAPYVCRALTNEEVISFNVKAIADCKKFAVAREFGRCGLPPDSR